MPFPAVTTRRAFLFYLALTALLFGRALNFEFVYDDHWRIYRNPAVQNIRPLSAYFLDPETQSGRSFHGDTFRPLTTIVYALTHALVGMNPAYFRIQNFLVHSANATLIFVIGTQLLGLSAGGALLAGALFLMHPLQLETVIWAAELSNALVLTLTLFALLAWTRYRKSGHEQWAFTTLALMLMAFLTRENAVCIAPMLMALSTIPIFNERISNRKIFCWLGVFATLTLGYILLRSHILAHFSQGGLWGGTALTNIANVLQIWPLYWQRLLWPDRLRIIYSTLPVVASFWDWRSLVGLMGFVCYLVLTAAIWKKNRVGGFSLLAFLIFWIPGSNIIPLNTLFAERLMYPMIGCAGWWVAMLVDRLPTRRAWAGALAALVVLAMITSWQLPVWRSEETVWAQAVNVEPSSWFAWGCLGNANVLIADHQTDSGQVVHFRTLAKKCYLKSLDSHPPARDISMILEQLHELDK